MNPIAFTEKVLTSFLRYQLTRYPFADSRLYAQMRELLSLASTRRTPLLKGPYVSLSRSFRQGAAVADLVADGVLHPFMQNIVPHPHVYGHQEQAIRSIVAGRTTLVSTGTGSGKSECFLYPVISRCLQLRDESAAPGITAVLIYPMNALAEDQLGRLRGLLAGTGITFGMYVGRTPERSDSAVGERLPAGASKADYQAAAAARPGHVAHPAEERCSREEMREAGGQPRILITNVKQLELLLTRQADAELFDGARLEFIVVDEAHTFSGAIGGETACLLRRLRAFCGKDASETTCIATSATIADPDEGAAGGRAFAARFFGVAADGVALVGEEYAPELWREPRTVTPQIADPPRRLAAVLAAIDAEDPEAILDEYRAMTGESLPLDDWRRALYDALASNEVVFQLATALERARALPDLLRELGERLGRTVSEEEVLCWLALGAASRSEERPLLRPVVHAFVRGVGGAVVTFPTTDGPEVDALRLWLSAEEIEAADDEGLARFPVLNCTTCGQHYFVHHLDDFDCAGPEVGGGQAIDERRFWPARLEALGGRRVVLLDRVVGAGEEDEEPTRTGELFLCRVCGAAHPAPRTRCDGCGLDGALVRLLVVEQKPAHPGYLTRCVSCGATGAARGSRYREPARPVRAVAVADVHVLAQDMVHHADRRRLLVFADNRQEAAFQAGWMRDHSRRFRLRALMAERIEKGAVSIGDLTAHLDELLEKDEELSQVLIPEVWDAHRREAEGLKHAVERKRYLRIQVFRELTMGVKQTVGLEPWGRLRVRYRGLDEDAPFIAAKAAEIDVPPSDLAHGIGVLLDIMRRRAFLLYDRELGLFSKFWQDGDAEILRGYMPLVPGVPRGLKLVRGRSDVSKRVVQWSSATAHQTSARQIVRDWGYEGDRRDAFLEELWHFLCDDLELLVEVTLTGSKGGPLPKCSGVRQIDADLLRLAPCRELYRCRKCHRAQVRRTPRMRCPGWRCDGALERQAENPDSYDLALLEEGVAMLRPREHSAQVPADERDRIERLFKDPTSDAVNTLVSTPTLELGVDIGPLDTVLMRNVPPLPANYKQRVGRAGRRHRMAVNLTYARPASHDQIYFADPSKLIDGRVDPPRFNLRNELMVRKHVHATILTRLHQLARPTSALGEHDRSELVTTLEQVFPRAVRGYLFATDGHVLSRPFDVGPLRTVVWKHVADLDGFVAAAFRQGWPEEDSSAVTADQLGEFIRRCPDRLDEVITRLRKRLNWARSHLSRLHDERVRKGALDPADDMQFRRCDQMIKRLKGMTRRDRKDAEGVDDMNTFAVLAAEGFLPGYGLDTGAVVGTAQQPRTGRFGRDLSLRRPTGMALREFVPGNLVYANGGRFMPRYYHFTHDVEPTWFVVDAANGAVSESARTSGALSLGLGANELCTIEMCDVELPHESTIRDDEEFRFQLGVTVLGYERKRHGGGIAYRWGARDLQHRRSVHLRLVNVGAASLVAESPPRLGYPLCLVCGQSRSAFASQAERNRFEQDHTERCQRPVESVGFYADEVADVVSLLDFEGREEAFSVLEALRTGAAQVLEMETDDLDVLVIGRAGTDRVDGLLVDPMPGGSGLLDQLVERFTEVVAAASRLCAVCPSDCRRACNDCLCRYRNAFFHRHLDRELAARLLATWGGDLERSHEIPATLPTSAAQVELPVNAAESALAQMLDRAGFAKPQWHHQIELGRPLGTTSPDCYWQDEDAPDEPGTTIYLDGLSDHLHGNPVTRKRDRAIREKLRADGFEVLEIAASELFDEKRMRRYFHTLGKLLIGKDAARAVRDDSSWYRAPTMTAAAAPALVAEEREATYGGEAEAIDDVALFLSEVDASCRQLVRGLTARGVALPVVGDEIVGDAGRVIGQAELSWPDVKVAVLLADHAHEREACVAAGWRVLVMPVTASEVAAVVGVGSQS